MPSDIWDKHTGKKVVNQGIILKLLEMLKSVIRGSFGNVKGKSWVTMFYYWPAKVICDDESARITMLWRWHQGIILIKLEIIINTILAQIALFLPDPLIVLLSFWERWLFSFIKWFITVSTFPTSQNKGKPIICRERKKYGLSNYVLVSPQRTVQRKNMCLFLH